MLGDQVPPGLPSRGGPAVAYLALPLLASPYPLTAAPSCMIPQPLRL